jgi:hypothetical protein
VFKLSLKLVAQVALGFGLIESFSVTKDLLNYPNDIAVFIGSLCGLAASAIFIILSILLWRSNANEAIDWYSRSDDDDDD